MALIPLTAVVVVFTIPAVIGNSLVLAAIIRRRRLHTASNMYICALAMTDIFICVSLSVNYIVKLFQIQYTYILCSSFVFSSFAGCVINLNLIEAISLDRFFAIYWPFKYRKYGTKSFAIKVCIFVVVSTVVGTGVFMWTLANPAGLHIDQCQLNDLITVPLAVIATVMTSLLALELTAMYSAMFYKAMKHQKSLQLGYFKRNNKDMSILDIKALKTCSVVLGAFFLMWTPPLVSINLAAFSKSRDLVSMTVNICMILPTINSTIDPIVYAIMRKDIRKGIKMLITKRQNVTQFVTHEQIS